MIAVEMYAPYRYPSTWRPDVLHAVHVPHEGFGQVGQIPLAEIAQRQLAQPLRQTAGGWP